MAGFLIVVGLTGSLLAFYPELERLLNPHFYPKQVLPKMLDPATLAELVETRIPNAQVNAVMMEANPGATIVSIRSRPDSSGQPAALGFDQIIVDPYTGEELARRQFGAISEGLINLMPFIYKLHYELALGKFGMWVLGICALIWTLDCFVGFYLTLPQRRKNASIALPVTAKENHPNWWRRWWPAWKIRWRASAYKLNFDLHRASGLWLWLVLLIFAWSSVYMNLWDTVYTWTTRAVFEYRERWTELPKLDQPIDEPRLSWREAQTVGERLMAEQSRIHGFEVEKVVALRLERDRGAYNYIVRSSRDILDRRGRTMLLFDADNGEFRLLVLPTGWLAGNTVSHWLYALHMANVFGLPWRIFVCILGLVIVMLSVTGIVIWMKKRRARSDQQQMSSRKRFDTDSRVLP